MQEGLEQIIKVVERTDKNMSDLIEIVAALKSEVEDIKGDVEDIKETMATKTDLAELREDLGGKIGGVQRGLDANFERHSALEARVSKFETEVGV